ncbi:MAG: hypothetical protein JO112_17040, partial [Planctomycetes bacterium]|nr:hypothetical protein [Planctomycetota bacterium]
GYGWGWQDSSVTSLEVGTVNGINFVADLNTGGVLKDSDGTGWHTLRTNVVSFNFQFVNGADSLTGVYLLSSGSRWHPPRFGFFDYTTLE